MGKLPKQTKRRILIKRFRDLGWSGPHAGVKGQGVGDHPEYMAKGNLVVKLPNPHRGDIGETLLKKILAEAHVAVEEWLGLPEKEEREGDTEAAASPEDVT